ncbi:MAG TPA: hypothetical protein VNS58_30815 [Puia sp.]|nr:hypothetical protein [Puia sp.]
MILKSIAPFIVMIALLIAVVILTTAILNYKLKKRIAESIPLNERIVEKLFKPDGWQLELLKWCLLLFFGGLGLIVLEFIPFPAERSPLPYGVESVFISIGFGIYYLMVRKQRHDQ